MRKGVFLAIGLWATASCMPWWGLAGEIDGVQVAGIAELDGQSLRLNGAGIRSKFLFDIYVGALYCLQPVHDADALLKKPSPAVVTMEFLYKEVSRDRLIAGWNAGFHKNQSEASMAALGGRLAAFNALFADGHRGDRYRFDFQTDGRTVVRLNGNVIGSISGEDFQRALLSVWIGKEPASQDLKRAMLGAKE